MNLRMPTRSCRFKIQDSRLGLHDLRDFSPQTADPGLLMHGGHSVATESARHNTHKILVSKAELV